MRTWIVAALVFLLVWNAPALRGDHHVPLTYTRFLVPIFVPEVAGAFGSRWRVETWFYWAGLPGDEANMVPTPVCRFSLCPFGSTLNSEDQYRPLPVEAKFDPASAVLLHVESLHAAEFTLTSRVWDVSRETDSAGTEIPIVREDRISAEPVHLLNVPIAARFRNMLRVYALPEVQDPEVEVRYYRMPPLSDLGDIDSIPLRKERVRLRAYPPIQGFSIHPSLAEVANFQLAPELSGKTALWIDVVPITPGLRIWAFVSITNNDTQQATLVTPSGR